MNTLPVQTSAVNTQFADLPNWVTWDYQHIPGKDKPKKPPYNPHTGRLASATDPATWATYAQAVAFARSAHMAGVGLVLTRNLGLTLVDLDNCFNGDGTLQPWAAAIVQTLDSYTEYSPSGKGLHILVYGAVAALKTDQVELYSDQRYTTVTGCLWGSEKPIRHAQAELDALRAQYAPTEQGTPSTPPTSGRKTDFAPIDASDAAVIAVLCSIPAQAARWAGSVSGNRSSHLYGLINGLIWLCGPDAERIGCLMRQSGLYDPDRHEKNSGAGHSNLDVSIFNAIRTWQGTPYKWPISTENSPSRDQSAPAIAPTKPDPEPAEPTFAERLEAARVGLRYGKLALMTRTHTKDTDLAVADTLIDLALERGRLDGLAIGLETLRSRAGLGSTSTARKALDRLGWLVTKDSDGDKVTRADVYSFVAPALDWLGAPPTSGSLSDLDNISTTSHGSGIDSTSTNNIMRCSGNIIYSYSLHKGDDLFSTGGGGGWARAGQHYTRRRQVERAVD